MHTSIIKIKTTTIFTIIVVFALSSCVSVKNNFLGSAHISSTERCNPDTATTYLSHYDKYKIDSLLLLMAERRRANKNFKAHDLNLLYEQFGKQLLSDQYYNCILQTTELNIDSLSEIQFTAIAKLLHSANGYKAYYTRNKYVRRILNRGNVANNIARETLNKSISYLYSPRVRKTLRANKKYITNPVCDSLIAQLPKTNRIIAFTFGIKKLNDHMYNMVYDWSSTLRYLFGTTIKKSKSLQERKDNAQNLLPLLQPFDIILSKSAEHITDVFIPGYFGHAAIWVGENIARGKSLKPSERKERKSINKKDIIEAIRSGVKTSSLKSFADGEKYLIIRFKNLSNDQKKRIVEIARAQLHKQYDFNFDIESFETLTCTELVYVTYDFVDWKTQYMLGRYIITPDNLVQTALTSQTFDIPYFIDNGIIIYNPKPNDLQKLLEQ